MPLKTSTSLAPKYIGMRLIPFDLTGKKRKNEKYKISIGSIHDDNWNKCKRTRSGRKEK